MADADAASGGVPGQSVVKCRCGEPCSFIRGKRYTGLQKQKQVFINMSMESSMESRLVQFFFFGFLGACVLVGLPLLPQ